MATSRFLIDRRRLKGKTYVVSALVLAHCAGRKDVVAPDTGPTAVRDGNSHIAAVRGFVE